MVERRTRERGALPGAARERFDPERLQALVLARLSVASKRAPSFSQLEKALGPLLGQRLSAREKRELLQQALAALRAQGQVQPEALRSTPAGEERLMRVLSLSGPLRARSWRELRSRYLPRLVLAAPSAVADVRLGLLAERLGVPLGPSPSLGRLLDRWLARELGLRGPVSPGKLRAALLARELGVPAAASVDTVLRQGLSVLSGAPRGTRDDITDALAARWVFGGAPAAAKQNGPASDEALLERVVAQVLRASAGPSARPYGPNKVFIASVWEALAFEPELRALGEEGFKALLGEAHRRGLLQLSRADLVAAMDPRDVAASETRHRNATYHFIVREGSA